MSYITATISAIKKSEFLHLVEFDFYSQKLSMISLDLNSDIKVGVNVKLVVKPTHISLCRNRYEDISFVNQLLCRISEVEKGELLYSVKLECFDTTLEAIITKDMKFQVGEMVYALINESEIAISEIV